MTTQNKQANLLTILEQSYSRTRYFTQSISLFLFCLFITILLLPDYSFAQYTYELDKTTRFEKMGAEEGLSTGYTTCIHQDKYGFIWIGSESGLNFYDGYEVKVFYANPKNPQSLYNNDIHSIFEEPDGTMWFCTNMGISKYNRANQTFTSFIPDTLDLNNYANNANRILPDGNYFWIDVWRNDLFRFNKKTGEFQSFAKDTINPSKGIHGENCVHIFIDTSGVLWVCSTNTGGDFVLSKFNKETGTFIHFQNNPTDPEFFTGKGVYSMIEDKAGTIWLATMGSGLLEITDKEKGKFRRYNHNDNDSSSIIHNFLHKVFEDSKGNIWTGGKDGFSKLNKKTGQFTNYQIPHYFFDRSKSNTIRNINEDKRGELWLIAYENFFRFDPSTQTLRHYIHDPENKNSLSSNRVFKIMHDHSGQDWILTGNNGINRLNHFSNSFRIVEKNSYDKNSLTDNLITSVFGDSQGNLWIGTSGKGLNKTAFKKTMDFSGFEHYVVDAENPKSINGNHILSINEDKEQTIWVGTTEGLNRYNARNNDFTRYQYDPNNPNSITSRGIQVTFEDSYGIFWVGTQRGLNIMNRKTGKFIHFVPDKSKPGSIVSNQIKVIYEDTYGELWFGGTYLERLNRKDTSFINYISDSIFFRDFKKKSIWNIIEDDSTNLWMTTYWDGIIKFQRIDSTFISITTDQGLPSNTIMAIEIDSKGFIWATSTKGLSKINPRKYTIQNYDNADGLVNLEFIEKSSFKDEDGWLYFGGRDGLTYFHPDNLKENKFIPPVYITSLNVAGEPKYFDKPLYEMSTIDLLYNENDFNFDFVALNYINSQKNQYAYKLEGYDEEWKYVGNRRTAYYTNLNPGEYTFKVKGSNNDGYWNEDGASLVIVILPPFWKTWWAYLFYAFAFIFLIYVLRRNELRKLYLRQELELKQTQAVQQAELDLVKSKFFSNISHEFRTPLTLILGPLERLIGSTKDEGQKDQLSLVRRNARRLQILINQLLSISKLESGTMKLRARPEDIVKLTHLFVQSFHSMAVDKGIRLDFESNLETCIVYLDTGKYEKVANNLLSNAFKFTDKGDKIKVSINATHEGAGGVSIKFSDTGVGIKNEDLLHVFDRFYQVDEKQMKTNLGTGIGLALTKELVELHHGTITAESKPGMGTTFTLYLPVGTYHLSANEVIEKSSRDLQQVDELLNDEHLFVRKEEDTTDLKTESVVNDNVPQVLIVEDNDDMRSYIKSYLVDSYAVIEASNGMEGVEQAIEHIPDLIVSDLMMPKLDGNEMTLQLKTDERTSHIPIILLTAKASKESKLEGLETGADDFLTKPFDAVELLVRINNLINQRKRLREVFGKKLSFTISPDLAELMDSGITSMDEQFLKKAFETAEREMSDPEFSVQAFSEQMGLSRMQLHRKLKALTDQSATEFIKIIRLNKAAVLLKAKSATTAEIAYDVGFNTPAYFSTCFKEHFGITPSEYAEN